MSGYIILELELELELIIDINIIAMTCPKYLAKNIFPKMTSTK